jgi:OmpA-OmpF porin, OOP family
MNLLDGLKTALGSQGIESIAGMLGENTHNTQMAATSGAASVLASLMQGAASNNGGGAANILKMITSGGHDGSALGNIAGLLSGGDSSGLAGMMSGGSGILSSLLGDKSSGIADLLGSITGVKSSSASSIMSMVAPMLLGMIGKNVGTGGVGGLMNLLMGQGDAVKAALPSGLSNLLGFNNFNPQSALAAFTGAGAATAANAVTQAKSTVTNTVNTVQDEVENVGGGFGNWWPWLLGALALLGALMYFRGCGVDTKKDADAAKAKLQMAQDSLAAYTKKKAAEASNALSNFVLPGGAKIEFPKGSVEDQLIGFVNDKAAAIDKNKWFTFEGLNFDTGKATLKAGSETKLSNVAAIMKAFPAVTIKLGGYTDNVGKPESNKTLSDARAKTVMGELVKLGVDAKRMVAEGYGQEHPAKPNDTEEGRAQNRRIDISVRTK